MADKKIIDMDGLAFFKQKQDDFNDVKFMRTADFIDDETGIILSEKLPATSANQVATLNEIGELFD